MKRSFAAVDSQDRDEDSHVKSAQGNDYNPKRQRQYSSRKRGSKEGSMSAAKKRARNIERSLSRNHELPANVQNDLERELAALKTTVAEKLFQKKRTAMISKYHMVRFFERKKASRLAKQLKRKIEQNPSADDVEDLKHQLHIAEVDEAYSIYHPYMEPYISLYGSSNANSKEKQENDEDNGEETKHTPAAKAALASERPPMWSVVENTMKQGIYALKQLSERRAGDDAAATSQPYRKPPKASQNKADKKPEQKATRFEAKGKLGSKDKLGPKDRLVPNDKHDDRGNASTHTQSGQSTSLNRRERRRLMREAMPANNSDDDEEGGGFFEGL
ncbi:rRNA-processing protein efg1 [Conoideocrella luteorostrata]|uniref:rRNA-processing protein EFG1 n=1 Tax=Conoideocrella luteorostrata TaxID=1105319 RepID=A0AAJ0CJC5_9HYPO|nr:rRNA-processing protein efg1 [Conoideocrella luteorostrata]